MRIEFIINTLQVIKMATKSKKYDFKKTLIKGLEIFIYGGVGALISYLSNLPQTETIVIAIAVLKMAQNYFKHKQ